MQQRSVRLVWRGRVQGVGFRATVRHAARSHGVVGWVRNRTDGSVEAHLLGAPAAIESTLAAIRSAHSHRIDSARLNESDAEAAPATFEIRATVVADSGESRGERD